MPTASATSSARPRRSRHRRCSATHTRKWGRWTSSLRIRRSVRFPISGEQSRPRPRRRRRPKPPLARQRPPVPRAPVPAVGSTGRSFARSDSIGDPAPRTPDRHRAELMTTNGLRCRPGGTHVRLGRSQSTAAASATRCARPSQRTRAPTPASPCLALPLSGDSAAVCGRSGAGLHGIR